MQPLSSLSALAKVLQVLLDIGLMFLITLQLQSDESTVFNVLVTMSVHSKQSLYDSPQKKVFVLLQNGIHEVDWKSSSLHPILTLICLQEFCHFWNLDAMISPEPVHPRSYHSHSYSYQMNPFNCVCLQPVAVFKTVHSFTHTPLPV